MSPAKKSTKYNAQRATTAQADTLHDLLDSHLLTDAAVTISAVTGMSPEQAEEVLRMVGGAHELARLSESTLQMLPHIGKRRSKQIAAMTEWALQLTANSVAERPEIRSPDDLATLLMLEMGLLQHEELRVIGLDSRYHIKLMETVYRGSLTGIDVRVAEIFAKPLSLKCSAIILAHNHPGGDPTPSREDIHLTELVSQCGEQLDLELRDHIIFGRQRYVSLRQKGLGFEV